MLVNYTQSLVYPSLMMCGAISSRQSKRRAMNRFGQAVHCPSFEYE